LKLKPLLYASLILVMPLLLKADTVQIVPGTPGDVYSLPPTAASPGFSTVINFSGLYSQTNSTCQSSGMDCPTFSSSTYASRGATISSPDGLLIYPFSTQTAGGVELYDPGATDPSTCTSTYSCDGTADIDISLAFGVEDLAVGIADSDDPLALTIDALDQSGNVIGTLDASTDIENASGNAYFVAEDSTGAGIYGLEIIQSDVTYGSGLALTEVEYTPEPSSLLFLIGGCLAIFGSARLRKKA